MSYTNPILELEKQKILLQKEYAAEQEAFQQQTEAGGIGRRMKRGDAWWPLTTGKAYYNSLNQYCIEVSPVPSQEGEQFSETDHNFEYGKPVGFFLWDGKDKPRYLSFTATISFVDGNRIVIALKDENHAVELQHPSQGDGGGRLRHLPLLR